jgi:hypothetical protein
VIGIDEVSIKKRHTYRIVVSDLVRERPIWFGGTDRSEASMDTFFTWLGAKKSAGIRMAVMDMWKPFRTSTQAHAPQASVLFDKFHVLRHLGEALDKVRKNEYARLTGKDRRFIKGQKYTLLSSRENLTLEGRRSLKPRGTPENRPLVDGSKPATTGRIRDRLLRVYRSVSVGLIQQARVVVAVGAGVRLPASKERWARVRLRVHGSGSFHSPLFTAWSLDAGRRGAWCASFSDRT